MHCSGTPEFEKVSDGAFMVYGKLSAQSMKREGIDFMAGTRRDFLSMLQSFLLILIFVVNLPLFLHSQSIYMRLPLF